MTLGELVYSFLEVKEASRDGEIWVKCPFCEDEKFRLGINLNDGRAHCFRGSCEWKTRDKKYLFTELCRHFGVEEEYTEEQSLPVKKKKKEHHLVTISLPDEYEALWTGINEEIGQLALKYVLDRGITKEQIKEHRLGFCAVGKYAWRIIFPVIYHRKIVGFTGRDFSDKSNMKYLNSESSKVFYNVPKVISSLAILSEGPVDALAIERAVDFDSLARLGSGLTGRNVDILKNYSENVFWPDPDLAGIDLCIKACLAMDKHTKVSVVMPDQDLEFDIDPGKLGETDSGLKEIKHRIARRVRWTSDLALQLRVLIGSL